MRFRLKGDDPMSDELMDSEERKAAILRITEEMTELSKELLEKAQMLQEEIQRARRSKS